jgi:hypothetical protein
MFLLGIAAGLLVACALFLWLYRYWIPRHPGSERKLVPVLGMVVSLAFLVSGVARSRHGIDTALAIEVVLSSISGAYFLRSLLKAGN